jgi:hypothetical protein
MSDKTYKVLLFMKRRPGMSVEAFRDYYETRHAPLCQSLAAGRGMKRYLRRYIDPQPHPETGAFEPSFDVITELWFDDEEIFNGTVAYLTTAIMPEMIIEDEKNLFDRGSFRIATVVECETDLEAARQPA